MYSAVRIVRIDLGCRDTSKDSVMIDLMLGDGGDGAAVVVTHLRSAVPRFSPSEFRRDLIVVRLFRRILIPNSIPQHCKSLPRNYL